MTPAELNVTLVLETHAEPARMSHASARVTSVEEQVGLTFERPVVEWQRNGQSRKVTRN